MPRFGYSAVDGTGRRISGEIDAETADAVVRALNQQGLHPIGVHASGGGAQAAGSSAGLFARRAKPSEITLFTQELALLLTAGQPLTRALSLIESDTSAPRIQTLAARLRMSLAGGKGLHEALAAEGDSFPPVYIGMVKAAEAAGNLASVLSRIADARDREQHLRAKFTSAMLYPAILIAMAIGAILLMIGVVVPQFKTMLGEQAHRLPAASLAVIAASDWLTANGMRLAVALAIGALALPLLIRLPAVQIAIERVLMATPLVGTIMKYSLTGRFCRTLGILLESGLRLPAALELIEDVIANSRARDVIAKVRVAVRQGADFTEPLRGSNVFPPMVTSLLRIGGESGTLAGSALRLAEMYEAKLDIALQRLASILEPAIILTISLFIGFIVLTIVNAIMGIYDLTGL